MSFTPNLTKEIIRLMYTVSKNWILVLRLLKENYRLKCVSHLIFATVYQSPDTLLSIKLI